MIPRTAWYGALGRIIARFEDTFGAEYGAKAARQLLGGGGGGGAPAWGCLLLLMHHVKVGAGAVLPPAAKADEEHLITSFFPFDIELVRC